MNSYEVWLDDKVTMKNTLHYITNSELESKPFFDQMVERMTANGQLINNYLIIARIEKL